MKGVGFEPTMFLTSRFYRPLASPICIPFHKNAANGSRTHTPIGMGFSYHSMSP